MDISHLEEEYNIAKEGEFLSEGEQVKRKMNFVKKLMSDNSLEVVNYHYSLLKKREYKYLYYSVRAAFENRPNADEFLIQKLSVETDPITQADILHIIGQLKSNQAAPLAREYVEHSDKYHREVALYVIGWVGAEDDILILQKHMLEEQDPHLRITAASAHRQIAWRLNDLNDAILKSLKVGFENEKDDGVLSWIIIMIGSVSNKKLGLIEDRDDPYVLKGDFHKAKKKTADFLKTIE